MSKTAVIIGASGLVGSALLEELLRDAYFTSVRVLSRRPLDLADARVDLRVIDFEDTSSLEQALIGGDAVFCTVGTTQAKVKGDMAAYRKVDYDIPVGAARACKKLGISAFALVSSVGADRSSKNFYLRLKGEVEDAVQAQELHQVYIFRPSMLLGKRSEFRPAERIGQLLMRPLSFLIPSIYKPITGQQVAKAMLYAVKKGRVGCAVFHYKEMVAAIP